MTHMVEETLVLIKPDGVARNLTGEILRRIEAKGYSLVDIRLVQPERSVLAGRTRCLPCMVSKVAPRAPLRGYSALLWTTMRRCSGQLG